VSTVSILTFAQALILAVGVQAGETQYEDAVRQTLKDGKPLLVFVTAKWCVKCQELKRDVLPELRRRGDLDEIHFAQIDFDEQKDLARRIVPSKTLPQLILLKQTEDGWRRWSLTGFHPAKSVAEFLKRSQQPNIAALPKKSQQPMIATLPTDARR
jgi:thiol:disulfide interchange protein